MINSNNIRVRTIWKKRVRGHIAGVTCLGAEGPLVICADSDIYVLSKSGKGLKKKHINANCKNIVSSHSSTCFAVLDTDGNIFAFTRKGKLLWQTHCENAGALAVGDKTELVITSPPYQITYYDAEKKKDPEVFKSFFTPFSVALIQEKTPTQIAIGGEMGELGVIDSSSKYLWEFSIGIQTGPISFDRASRTLLVPAFEDGVYMYGEAGESKGDFQVKYPVSFALAANTSFGLLCAIKAEESIFQLTAADGTPLWEVNFDIPITAIDIAKDGSWMAIATSDGKINAYSIKLTHDHTSAFTSDYDEDTESHIYLPPDITQTGDEAAASKALQPPEAHVFGDFPLKGGLLPKSTDRLKVSSSGHRIVASLPGGDAILLNQEGKILADARIDAPARVLESNRDDFFMVWNPEKLLIVNNENHSCQSEVFDVCVKQMDCSDDLRTISLVNKKNELVVRSFEGEIFSRQKLVPASLRMSVSPGGETVLVEDSQLQYVFFNKDGDVKNKQKFSSGKAFDFLLLKDDSCTFISKKGLLISQDFNGEVFLKKKFERGVRNAYLLGDFLIIEDDTGVCRLIERTGKTFWEFDPPPGKSLIRMPAQSDPILLLARRKLITAFEGYKKKMTALWSFRCEDTIDIFDADREGKFLVVGAGGRLYFIGSEAE